MATPMSKTSVLPLGCVLSWCLQSEVVPPGFFNFPTSVEELLCDSRINVNVEQLECVRSLVFTWAIIAVMLCVSRTTIWPICQEHGICNQRYTDISEADLDAVNTRPGNLLSVTGHFSVKINFTVQFRKYRSLCSRQVKPIGVEHLLFFRIRNELQFVKARKVFSKLTQVKLSCRNTIGDGSYMTNVLQ